MNWMTEKLHQQYKELCSDNVVTVRGVPQAYDPRNETKELYLFLENINI